MSPAVDGPVAPAQISASGTIAVILQGDDTATTVELTGSMNQRRPLARAIAPLLIGGAALASITGCGFIQQQVGDAWVVTYEVTVDQPVGSPFQDVAIEGAEERGGAPSVRALDEQATTAGTDGGSEWTHESIVLAEDNASVRATPAPDAVASCRILVGGGREIASETASAPGAEVHCSASTPGFD